ncbi:MAG: hypothetical protein P1V36_17460, partial [Planctomycetota bacterium]|nr:hypothetical protein [Planctomycetota bacterium]
GRPGHVEILVRRAEGGVAAWARVEVLLDTKREWDNLDGEDVLRLAPRTDHAGRATLHNLSHGQHIVRATWLGRRIEAPVVVDTGSRARLDLELPAPKGWPPIGSR